jgi:hypothetical protein
MPAHCPYARLRVRLTHQWGDYGLAPRTAVVPALVASPPVRFCGSRLLPSAGYAPFDVSHDALKLARGATIGPAPGGRKYRDRT